MRDQASFMKTFWILLILIHLTGIAKLSSEGIVVKGKKSPIESAKLSQEEIRRIPGGFGEPLRVIETLPGVGITSFILGEFSIRGASPNANTIYIDNLPVGYLFHTFGVHSVVHRSIIQNLTLDSGIYSAKYQNAIGGIISIETPNKQVLDQAGLEASLLSLSGSWSVVSEDFQDYIIAAGRASTLNQTYGRLSAIVQDNTFPDYGNVQLKAKKMLNPNHSIYFYTFFANDIYKISIPTEPRNDEEDLNPILAGGSFDYSRYFLTSAIRWQYESGSFKNQLSGIYFISSNATTANLVNIEIDSIERFQSFGFRQDATYSDPFRNQWEFGVEAQSVDSRASGITSLPRVSRSLLPDPFRIFEEEFTIQEINRQKKSVYATGYLQSTIPSLLGIWTPGIRYETFTESGISSLTPRIRWDRTHDPGQWNLFVKAGSMSRFPREPLQGRVNLVYEKADTVSLGFLYPWKRFWFFQIEPFYVNYRDLILRNTEISSEFENSEIGISRGIEFILRKSSSFRSGYFGWLSYTYSENKRRLNREGYEWFESDFDLRHNLNLLFGYKIDPEWSVGLRYFARSSFPYTSILGDDGGKSQNPFTNQRIYYPIFSPYRNTSRLPAFHRLDLRIDRNIYYEWGLINFYLEFLNLYGRNNFVGVTWNPARSAVSELNPQPSLDPTTFRIQNPGITLPLINFGLEVQF